MPYVGLSAWLTLKRRNTLWLQVRCERTIKLLFILAGILISQISQGVYTFVKLDDTVQDVNILLAKFCIRVHVVETGVVSVETLAKVAIQRTSVANDKRISQFHFPLCPSSYPSDKN